MNLPALPPGLVRPQSYSTQLPQVVPAALAACGIDLPSLQPNPAAAPVLPAARRLCLAMIDGMGWEQLRASLGYARFLRSQLTSRPGPDPVGATVMPSTTACAITSAMTGLEAGEHRMISYAVRQRSSGKSFNLINFAGAPLRAEDLQNRPTVFEHLAAAGLSGVATGPKKFIGRGLSRAALRGSNYRAAESLEDRALAAAAALREGAIFSYFYAAEVDHAGHHYGWQSPAWTQALEQVDQALERLARALPPDTLLLVVADHGMVDTSPEDRYDLAKDPQIAHLVRSCSGEGRALHVNAKENWVQELGGALRRRLLEAGNGEGAWILEREEFLAAIGAPPAQGTETAPANDAAKANATPADSNPPHPDPAKIDLRDLCGDYVIFSNGNRQVVDSRWFSGPAMDMVGLHGSLTPAEIEIPVIPILTGN